MDAQATGPPHIFTPPGSQYSDPAVPASSAAAIMTPRSTVSVTVVAVCRKDPHMLTLSSPKRPLDQTASHLGPRRLSASYPSQSTEPSQPKVFLTNLRTNIWSDTGTSPSLLLRATVNQKRHLEELLSTHCQSFPARSRQTLESRRSLPSPSAGSRDSETTFERTETGDMSDTMTEHAPRCRQTADASIFAACKPLHACPFLSFPFLSFPFQYTGGEHDGSRKFDGMEICTY